MNGAGGGTAVRERVWRRRRAEFPTRCCCVSACVCPYPIITCIYIAEHGESTCFGSWVMGWVIAIVLMQES